MKRKTIEQFIIKSNNIHKNKYNYSLVEYTNCKTKVKIICPVHGEFKQTPNDHLQGGGCTKCKFEKLRNLYSLTTEQFIKKSKEIHGNKYDYSLVNYINNRTNVKIICKIHGEFEQTPYKHLNNRGCQLCGGTHKKSLQKFIEKSNKIHNNKYDYSLVEYINNKTNVKIICPIHKVFEQTPSKHINTKHGCPFCNESKGENKIKTFLHENDILFERQKTFDNCKNKRKLKFDFYLPKYNTCIEYDGEQHFNSIKYFGGDYRLKYIKINDRIKDKFCIENNIKLIRISYNQDINYMLKHSIVY